MKENSEDQINLRFMEAECLLALERSLKKVPDHVYLKALDQVQST